MKAWDLLRSQFKPDGKGRYKTTDAMLVAKQLEKEVERLQKYEKLVQFIANDYHELSHDKAKWQRDDWKRRCKELIQAEVEK
jgi:hypothetical protein